jgi:hypothetical protein
MLGGEGYGRSTPLPPSSNGIRALAPTSDVAFASSLDNARKCFLVLKCVYLPLCLLMCLFSAQLNAMWFLGRISLFSNTHAIYWYIHGAAQAIVIAVPTFLVPRIIRFRVLSNRARSFVVNSLFVAMCLLWPVINANKVWRRQYTELNGFLLVHELMPSAPPRVRPAAVAPHQPLSICDDEPFLFLWAIDHVSMMWSNFMMWNFIELPHKYFFACFSLHIVHFWASAYRGLNVYASACGSDSDLGDVVRHHWVPVLHMVQLLSSVSFLMTRSFFMSHSCEENKRWLMAVVKEAVANTNLHFRILFRLHSSQTQLPTGTFWSRTELIFSSPKESPLLLPANVGAAFKTCLRLRDFGVFVIGFSLPIYFAFFELMRQIIIVEPRVRKAVYVFFLKCAIIVAIVSLPRTIFAKALCQRRVWSSWVIMSSCCILAIVVVGYLMPGSMGQKFMDPIPRCFCCLTAMSVFPPAILRAFSRNASALFIILIFSIIYTHVAQFPFLSLNFTHPLAVCSNLNAQAWLLRAVPRTHPALLQRNKRRKSCPRSPPADRFRVDAVRSGERSFRKRPAVPVPAAGQEAP